MLVQNTILNVYTDQNTWVFLTYLFGMLFAVDNALGTMDFKISSLLAVSYYLMWRQTGQPSHYRRIIVGLEIEKEDKEYQRSQESLRKGFKREELWAETIWISRGISDWRLEKKIKTDFIARTP